MSKKLLAWRHSITARLALLYILSTFILLWLLGIFLYLALDKSIKYQNYQFLVNEVNIVRHVLNEPNNQITLAKLINNEKNFPLAHTHYFYRIINQQGQIITETVGMSQILPVKNFNFLTAVNVKPRAQMIIGTDGRTFLVMNVWATVDKQQIIQAALDVHREVQVLADYRRNMILVLFLGILGSALISIFITRRGLQPLNEIAKSTESLRLDQLHQRLTIQQWPQELHVVVNSLNNLLNRIEENFKRLSQFSSDLAHELRTPINNLMGETELALTRTRSQEEYQKVLNSNLEEYDRLSRLINNLLFIARSEYPHQHIKREIVWLPQALEKLCEYHKILAEEQGVNIVCQGAAKLYADPILFHQALSNLLVNAIRHTAAGGTVTIVASQNPDLSTKVTVTDNGMGISPQHLPHLFDRFYRADAARSKKLGGTGLGLAIVKSIMELHQGQILINSTVGVGTEVQLIFPPKQ